jgi:hypothetical protein
MKERAEFLGKLQGLVLKAREQNSQITIDEVKQYFEDAALTEEQMELVFDYLLSQKVVVKGYIKMADEEEKEISYTEEEQTYLRDYEEDLKAFKKAGEGECEVLFQQAIEGNGAARNRLTEIYLPEVLEIAKSMYQPDIFLGDLIQEGNLGLVLGLDMLTDVRTARETLRQQIRQSIQALIEEYMDSEKSSMYLPVNDNLYIGLMTNIRMLFLDAHVTDLNGNLITILCLQYKFDIEKETYSIKNRTDTESDNIYEYLNEGKI